MKTKIALIILITGIIALAIACNKIDEVPVTEGLLTPATEVSELSVVCVGDIMAHKPQYVSAYDSATGTYNFDNNYTYVKKYIEAADVALCNVETVFSGGEPQGYPMFNAPDELANAIKNAGFDVALTSNNHMIDQGTVGVERTLQVLQAADLKTVGSRLTEEEPEYTIIDSEGVKIGIVSYTYETTGSDTKRSINANYVPEDIQNRVCSFNPVAWQNDITKIENNINLAREAGANIIICYLHWGEEYRTQPLDYQVNMANQLIVNAGVDVIFASHPHVIEPAVVVWSDAWKKNVPIFYSIGNFISNQRTETLGASRRNTEDGLIAGVNFEITKSEGQVTKVEMVQANVLPTWVNRYGSAGNWEYEIVPLDNSYGNNKSLTTSGNVAKADKSITDSLSILGTNYERDDVGRIMLFDAYKWRDENNSDKEKK